MFGIAIISKKKLEELKQSAYYSGFQAARSVGYSDPSPPSYGSVEHRGPYAASSCRVTSDNTHAANTAVQEMKADVKQVVHDMHKRVDTAQKRITYKRNQRLYRGRQRSAYTDKNIVLIYDGDAVERYLLDTMHELTLDEMVQSINKNLGTHVRGKRFPMRVTTQLLSKVINRKVYWNKELGYFIRQNGQ